MKARYVLLPVVVFGALSLVGACSSDSSDNAGTAGSAMVGGENAGGNGATSNTGATSNGGNQDGGGTDSLGGVGNGATSAGGASGGAGGAADLCADFTEECPDDDNPCTEDACNPATGECGIPRTDTACDDNVYCNGPDLCDAGACTKHSGNPCASNTCSEPGKTCSCAVKEDCSEDQPGDWSDCVYADECTTTGTQSRPVTTYTCNVDSGKCEGKLTLENRACTRETQDQPCTSNNLRCDGAETCKAGKCTPAKVNPCAGNGADKYCSESNAQCGVCSGNAVQGSYPGCGAGQYCCYNQATPSAWACQNTQCPLIIKTIVPVTTKITTFAAP